MNSFEYFQSEAIAFHKLMGLRSAYEVGLNGNTQLNDGLRGLAYLIAHMDAPDEQVEQAKDMFYACWRELDIRLRYFQRGGNHGMRRGRAEDPGPFNPSRLAGRDQITILESIIW